ncbi:hypothetical protein OPV22_034991 [Ensete ventricosum]|uniref:Uncharacterized protein n=2 Tax=Ensete ventricosum TaxID=4639 RepID=A0AAV8PJH2_ENSVE|nr:hypothetical protein OPV22_034958 [Ensete ventricosum]KAJ8455862.1 hypothetical protein OPV22_034965 [Ensete ventricosum]KAJ8455874.1 hypothetical protein OPV22_034977 [Ensete ventricosum]KAJ8455884.1 hypothetical protein OPV22_034987 [Ensete ventricosum]KAJ8455888.1 hypothetical protein OPV22_034991 [Ensete ventricosum]
MRKCRRQPRAAAGIASARPVAKCRCERCCSRHCECPSRRQVQMCRIQARAQISSADVSHELQQALREWPSRPQVQMRALLQQAALRVAVPSPSADVQNSAASADFKCRCQPRAAAGIASGRPVPSPSADASAAAAGIASANPMPKCRCAEFSRERCCSRQHCDASCCVPTERTVPSIPSNVLLAIIFDPPTRYAPAGTIQWDPMTNEACCGGTGERSVVCTITLRIAGKVLPFASFAVRRSPLARAAKNGQFWPVFGPFSRAAATVASGKVPPVASFALRRSPLARAAENGQFWPVFGPFSVLRWARERSSGRGIGVAGKVLPFASFAVRRSPLARAAKNGQFWPVFGPFSRAAAIVASGAKRQPSQHPGTPRVAQGWMGLSYSREGAARRFVRSPPLAARSGGPKRPVLACFWAVLACCGGRSERSSGRGIRAAGKVLPFASFAVRRSPLARAAKNGQFWPVFGPFSRAAATAASGAKRQPSQHPGTPRVAQGWMGLSYSREGAARRFVRSPPLAARPGGPKRPVLACFWAVFACWGGRGERSSGRGIRVAGKVLPFASFAVRRSPLARAAKNGQFWPLFGPFSRAAATAASGAKRQPSQHPGTPRVAQGWMGLSYSREGAARRFVRSPPLAARSGGPKRPVLACFWAVFVCCGGRGERSSGRGIRVAGKVLPFASFAVRRSPLARAAKNGQFWPVFGPFSRAAATVASGAKRQPFQHPGTPRVAQGWMGLSYSREGAARRFVRSPPLAARSGGRKRPVLACFWAVFACCGGRVSGRLDVALV